MHILGVSYDYHDSAAALISDGQLVAAAEEERFSRVKHSAAFPTLAIEYCLSEAGISIDDVNHIVFYEKTFRKFERLIKTYLSTWPRSWWAFARAMPTWLTSKLWVRTEILKQLGGYQRSVLFTGHHESHAGAAFLVSPFEEAAILTLDGVGEWTTTTMGVGRGNAIDIEREIRFPHSLGLFYTALTAYLGFRVNDAEWKVMGLAPYGKPRYAGKMRELIEIRDDGGFRLNMRYFAHHHSIRRMYNRRYERLFGRKTREPESDIDGFWADIAASGQQVIEEAIVNLARAAHARYGLPNLCIAGGVGLNSVANWKVLEQTPFKNLFIQPAAGDDGGALGAAFFVWNTVLGNPRTFEMRHAYWGPAYSNEEIQRELDSQGCVYRKLDGAQVIEETARLVTAGRVVGWFQGRMEFGPRALGARSIVGDAQNPEMKRIINTKIKYREWFRPFAPSVIKEAAATYFELDGDSPYMLLVPRVRDKWRAKLPAITHEDGSGRVQTVERDINPRWHALIKRVGELGGIPVVVNTSFNIRGEPIVNTPFDAFKCLMRTGIDDLVIGDFMVSKDDNGQVPRRGGGTCEQLVERLSSDMGRRLDATVSENNPLM